MAQVLLVLFGLMSLAVAYLALLGVTTSGLFIGVYLLASIAAYFASRQRPEWSGRLKWGWYVLSIIMIVGILRRMAAGLLVI